VLIVLHLTQLAGSKFQLSITLSFGHLTTEKLSASGGFTPDPLTTVSAPGLHWGSSPYPRFTPLPRMK